MKEVFFLFSLIICLINLNAQDNKQAIEFTKGFHFSGGINAALPIGNFSDVYSFGIGAEVLPEYRFSRRLAIVGSTGYTEFFGKDNYDNVGFIPILVGLRGYILPHLFIGSKWGAGILTGGGVSQTWFNAQPGLGYDGNKIQTTLGFNLQRDHGENLEHLSLSLLYKFK